VTFESDRMDDAAYTEEDEEHAANGSQVQIYDMLAYWGGWDVFILESACWSVGEMLCLKFFQQYSSHLNETCHTRIL